MNDRTIDELVIDYAEGQLSGDLQAWVAAQLEKDATLKSRYEDYLRLHRLMEDSPPEVPDGRLWHNFQQRLEQEKRKQTSPAVPVKRMTPPLWFGVAAAVALIILGIGIGRFWPGKGDSYQAVKEVTALRQEVAETKALLQQVVHGNLSASQRLDRVRGSYQLEQADPEILDVLIRTMNTDRSVNVRIAAIKALAEFTDEPTTRQALVQSLNTQKDPSVQRMLIHLLVQIKESRAIPPLQKIIRDKLADPAIQDEAQVGIFRLS